MIPQETVDHLEVIMWSVLAMFAVGAVVITLVGGLTYLLTREPHGESEVATVMPKPVAAAPAVRAHEPVDMTPAMMG